MAGRVYRIGEVAKILGVNTSTLRFWEDEFSQLRPRRTDTGQRYYTQKNLDLLFRIHDLLHKQGMTISGAQKVISEKPVQGKKNVQDEVEKPLSVQPELVVPSSNASEYIVHQQNLSNAQEMISETQSAQVTCVTPTQNLYISEQLAKHITSVVELEEKLTQTKAEQDRQEQELLALSEQLEAQKAKTLLTQKLLEECEKENQLMQELLEEQGKETLLFQELLEEQEKICNDLTKNHKNTLVAEKSKHQAILSRIHADLQNILKNS